MKTLALAFAALSLVSAPMAASAAPCKDAKGKFIKCPQAKPVAKKGGCRDAKGKFIKCK
jgi:hypothetical protein